MFSRIANQCKSPYRLLRAGFVDLCVLALFAEVCSAEAVRRLIFALFTQRHHDQHKQRGQIRQHLEDFL